MSLAHFDLRTLLVACAAGAMFASGCAAPSGGGGGGAGGEGTVTRDLEFDTGEAGDLEIIDGEETTGTGTQDLSNDVPSNPQSGTIAILDDDILFGDAGAPKWSVAAQDTGRSASISVFLAPTGVETPCSDEYAVLAFTATETAAGITVNNASASLSDSALSLVAGGEFQYCLRVVADFDGTVTVRMIRISVVGDVSDDDSGAGNTNDGNGNANGDDAGDDGDDGNGNGGDDDADGNGNAGNGNGNDDGEDGMDVDPDDSGDDAQATRFTATLVGDTQVPDPVITDTTGFAVFELNASGTVLSYSLDVRDGVDILFAHIHAGEAGENGLVVADLFAPDETLALADGEIATGQITADDLQATLSGQTLSALIDLLVTGSAYVNVHSQTNSTGEVRGQISPDDNPDDDTLPPDDDSGGDVDPNDAKRFAASLAGDEQPVPVATTTTGSAEFDWSEDGQSLTFTLSVFDGVNLLNAHIHEGSAGTEGGVIANLFTPDDPLAAADGEIAAGTLTSADLTGSLAGGSLADLIDLLRDGSAYVNVHTIANPSGEIRGQVFPADADDDGMDDDSDVEPNDDDGQQFRAELSGDKQVPEPVATAATGEGVFTLSDDGMSLSYTLSVFDGANIDVAHIHVGSANQNGSVVVFLFGEDELLGEANGQIASGTITAADFQGPLAGAAFSDLIDALSVGEAYVNVHTLENPAGELRGQIEPVE